ncbi:MAG: glycosyltransferase [Alphaproteobacteria bacterium]
MKVFNIMLASGKGGLEQMAVVYAKALVNAGNETHCLVVDNCSYKEDMIKTGAIVHTTKTRNLYNIFNIIKILKLIKEQQTDIVICHGNRAMSIVLNKLSRLFVKSIFKTIGVMHSKNCPYKNRIDNLVFLTDTFFNEQTLDIQKKSFILANTILDESYPQVALHSPIVFGAMGRLHQVKGYDILLSAISKLHKKGLDFKFVLGGTGPDEENLKQQAKELGLQSVVEFIGWVGDKKAFFDKIDAFVLSSRSERMPLVILETFAYSKAIISTNCQGPNEVVAQLPSHLIVPTEDVDALASAMETLLTNPQKVSQMAQEGNDLFNAKYNLEIFQQNLNSILKKCI